VQEECRTQDGIDGQELSALQPGAFTIGNLQIHDPNRNDYGCYLKGVKQEIEGMA
jgi:hypothetical protein